MSRRSFFIHKKIQNGKPKIEREMEEPETENCIDPNGLSTNSSPKSSHENSTSRPRIAIPSDADNSKCAEYNGPYNGVPPIPFEGLNTISSPLFKAYLNEGERERGTTRGWMREANGIMIPAKKIFYHRANAEFNQFENIKIFLRFGAPKPKKGGMRLAYVFEEVVTDSHTGEITTIPMVAKVFFREKVGPFTNDSYRNEVKTQCMSVDCANNFNIEFEKAIKEKGGESTVDMHSRFEGFFVLSCFVVEVARVDLEEAIKKRDTLLQTISNISQRIQSLETNSNSDDSTRQRVCNFKKKLDLIYLKVKNVFKIFEHEADADKDKGSSSTSTVQNTGQKVWPFVFAAEPVIQGQFIKYNSNNGIVLNPAVLNPLPNDHYLYSSKRAQNNNKNKNNSYQRSSLNEEDLWDIAVGGLRGNCVVKKEGEAFASPLYGNLFSPISPGKNIKKGQTNFEEKSEELNCCELFEFAEALSHFSLDQSGDVWLLCDLQGIGNVLTDPQLISIDGKGLGMGNVTEGIAKWVVAHKCNTVCERLNLKPLTLKKGNENARYDKNGNLRYIV